jgi:hypothetical protein
MSTIEAVKLYELGQRGRPVAGIRAGDLADPYARTPWQSVKSFFRTMLEVAREARELEEQMLAKSFHRGEG